MALHYLSVSAVTVQSKWDLRTGRLRLAVICRVINDDQGLSINMYPASPTNTGKVTGILSCEIYLRTKGKVNNCVFSVTSGPRSR